MRKNKRKDTVWGGVGTGKTREQQGSLRRFSHLVTVSKKRQVTGRLSPAGALQTCQTLQKPSTTTTQYAQAYNLTQEMRRSHWSAASWKMGSRRDDMNICLVNRRICFSTPPTQDNALQPLNLVTFYHFISKCWPGGVWDAVRNMAQ